MKFNDWYEKKIINEGTTRYSVEVNFRTKSQEVLQGFAKLALGYVSAAVKKQNYHVKQILDEKPMRIIVSSRNWDDGEWVGMISFNADDNCFVISNGFYNKDRKTVSVQRSDKCKNDTPSELTKSLLNMMHSLKDRPDRHQEKLNPVHLKRGPKG